MDSGNDMILMDRIRQGDAHAFELLFKKYYASLCLFAVKFTGIILDDARDIVQNLFMVLWENRAVVRIEYSVKGYLTSAVRRNCIRFMQQRRSTVSLDDLPEDSHIADELHDSLELEELYWQLLKTIEQLPPQCQKIFRMSRFEDMKYAEIAQELNISVKTVEAQMGKALKFLHTKLDHHLLLWIIVKNANQELT